MMFIIRDEDIRERLIELIKHVDIGATVKVSAATCPRTVQQNNTMHMWCSDFVKSGKFTLESGAKYDDGMMKWEFKSAYLPHKKWVNMKGKEQIMPISTADLSVTQFSGFLEKIQLAAAQYEIPLTDPSAYGLKP